MTRVMVEFADVKESRAMEPSSWVREEGHPSRPLFDNMPGYTIVATMDGRYIAIRDITEGEPPVSVVEVVDAHARYCPRCGAHKDSERAKTTCGFYHTSNDCPMRKA